MATGDISPAKELAAFLQNHKASRGGAFTHTSICNPCGSYYIPPTNTDKFMDLYKAAVVSGDTGLHLTEKHMDVGPVVIDLDFRFQLGGEEEDHHSCAGDVDDGGADPSGDPGADAAANGEGDHVVPWVPSVGGAPAEEPKDVVEPPPQRKYTTETITSIVGIYGGIIASFVDELDHFDMFVMEKPAPVFGKNNIVKDGIHIVIPEVVTTPMFQYMVRDHAMPIVKKELAGLKLFNKISDVLDEAVIEKNNWQMLGSRKGGCEQYAVTHIYRYDTATGDIEDLGVDPNDHVYIDRLSIRNKFRVTSMKPDRREEIDRFEQRVNASRLKQHFRSTIVTKVKDTRTNQQSEEDFKQAQALVGLLVKERAESYNDWIRVGWCLRNIDCKLLDDWIAFSRLSSKFRDGDCDRHWNFMRQDTSCLGVGTLHLWAKTDNPTEYAKMVGDELRSLIRESCNGSEYDVARVVQRKYNNTFAYDCGNKIWYHFHNHRWHLTHDGMAVKMKLPTEVAAEYRKAATHYNNIANLTQDTAQRNTLDELVTKLQSIVHKLKKASFQSNVMTECAMLFNHDNFDDKLDSSTHIIGFNNGVYDLNAMEFREGRPEDYVSLSTRINYAPLTEQLPETVGEVNDFFGKVLPNDKVRNYVLRLFSSFLHGNIREERFHVWTGSGCHKINTPIMMFDGTLKMVQDVEVGDVLMGDDSTPRNVQQLFSGKDKMFEIIPDKGDPFVVNKGHSLSLMASEGVKISGSDADGWQVKWKEFDAAKILVSKTEFFDDEEEAQYFSEEVIPFMDAVCNRGDILDMSVEKYVQHSTRFGERYLSLYRAPVDAYPSKPVEIDPYELGTWLGDNDFKMILNKHIPSLYMYNSREVRLQMLAGIIDGPEQPRKRVSNRFEIIFDDERLMDDLIRLTRSLGLVAFKKRHGDAYMTHILADVKTIPTRFQAPSRVVKSDTNTTPFDLRELPEDDYYGFEVDGNHRFLMGDFTVTRNSNGKSKCIELYQKAFGDYCCTLPIALLTQKRGTSNAATPELARAKAKRFAVLQEPGENERLNIGLMKEMTGGDKVYARGLYREGTEFKPQFKMILTCNHLPLVPSDDGGTWRRIRVVKFESKFCDNPDPNNHHEFPIDTSLSQRFDEWAEVFMSILIEHHRKLVIKKFKDAEPDEVLECTREYQRRNDVVADFMECCVVKDVDGGTVLVDHAYSDFKTWLKDEGLVDRGMRKSDFVVFLERRLGKPSTFQKQKGWKGFKLKSMADMTSADAPDALDS